MQGRNLVNWVLLLCVLAGCGKYHDQNQPEEERVYKLYLGSGKETRTGVQTGTGGRNLKQKSWRNATSSVLGFLYTTQDYPPIGGMAHSGPRLSTPIINQEGASLTCSQANGMKVFLELRFPPPLEIGAWGSWQTLPCTLCTHSRI